MNNAIFLVGIPGSGKDIILKNVLSNFVELTLEQAENAFFNKLDESDKRYSLIKKESIVISTNATNYDSIKKCKNLLENFGYNTSMIFVDVLESISKERLFNRKLNEESWKEKYTLSKENLNNFKNLFENFIVYENNYKQVNYYSLNYVNLFVENFISGKNIIFEGTKDYVKNKSIRKKLLLKLPKDSLSNEYPLRGAGVGYPATVGAMYSEDMDNSNLPAFASPERSIPDAETLKANGEIKNKRLDKIKKIAVLSWKGNEK